MEEQHYQLLDGKAVSAQMKKEMAEEVAQIKAAGGKIPHLAAILVGHDGGSETYVASKVKTCQEIGFKSTLIRFEEDVTEEELLRKVDELNNDPDVDGFIVQLPLPKHISEQKVIEAIIVKTWTVSIRLTWDVCLSVCLVSYRLRLPVSWNY